MRLRLFLLIVTLSKERQGFTEPPDLASIFSCSEVLIPKLSSRKSLSPFFPPCFLPSFLFFFLPFHKAAPCLGLLVGKEREAPKYRLCFLFPLEPRMETEMGQRRETKQRTEPRSRAENLPASGLGSLGQPASHR